MVTCSISASSVINNPSPVHIDPGQEYPAVVEFAPFQKISKKKLKKKDAKAGSIEEGTVMEKSVFRLFIFDVVVT